MNTGDPSWFAKGGAMMTAVGLLIDGLPALSKHTGDQMLAWEARTHPADVRWKSLIAITGTVIWAFGADWLR